MNTTTRIGMPMAAFIREGDQRPFEFIDGIKIYMHATTAGHNDVAKRIYDALLRYEDATGRGEVRQEMTYALTDDPNWVTGSRIPDVAFILAERIAQYRASTPDWREKPLLLVPDLVVEIVSPNDSYSEIDKKVDLYLADGVQMIVIVDPQRKKIRIHYPNAKTPISLTLDDTLEGGDLLPDFRLPLRDIFEDA
jgi:Uma2 family endonuclease